MGIIDRFFRFLNRQIVSKEAGERSSIENALASSQGDHHSHSFKRKVDRSHTRKYGQEKWTSHFVSVRPCCGCQATT